MSQGKIVLMACGSFSPPTPMHLRMFEIARDHIESQGTHTVIGGVISPVHDAYGKKNLVSAQHRCAMLKLALKSSDWIKMSDWEINQEGWTRSGVTLQHHQDQLDAFLNGTANVNETPPSWLPDVILNEVLNNNLDEPDNHRPSYDALTNGNILESDDNRFARIDNQRRRSVNLKLLCGADLLESFATPNLWADEDLETILGNHGLVVVTRSGSNPERFVYESDMLSRFKRHIMLITNWVPNEVSSTVIRRLLARGESVKYLIDDAVIHYIRENQLFGTKAIKRSATEYELYDAQTSETKSPITPDDISMTSPSSSIMETGSNIPGVKNILISIRDGPLATRTANIPAKKSRKTLRSFTNLISSNTDTVAPVPDLAPKIVYCDNMNLIYPGKAVKVVKNLSGQDVVITDDEEVGISDKNSSTVHASKIIVGENELTLGKTDLDIGQNELSSVKDFTFSKYELIPNDLNLGTNKTTNGKKDIGQKKKSRSDAGITYFKNNISSGETESISGQSELNYQQTKMTFQENKSTSGENELTNDKIHLALRKKNIFTGETEFTFGKNQFTCDKNKLAIKNNELLNLSDEMDKMKLGVGNKRESYDTRSCNDVVKLVLTKHGIHVISDKEAIV